MTDAESFLAFSTQAQTLQSMVNFEQVTVSNFEVAEAVSFGFSAELRSMINNFKLLLQTPFAYSTFKRRTQFFFDGLPRRPIAARAGLVGQPVLALLPHGLVCRRRTSFGGSMLTLTPKAFVIIANRLAGALLVLVLDPQTKAMSTSPLCSQP